ncbi:MAG TPA: phosphate ABC transporter permease PstA [Pirellulales bacterium]|nr:phosphate ABC transporter permease PstA [Pirellulales bacterium]
MSAPLGLTDPFEGIDLPRLEKSIYSPRAALSGALSLLTAAMTLVAMLPLVSVLTMLLWRGGRRLSIALFTETPPSAFSTGGGFGNAIVGTLVMVGIAALVSVPFGILAAVFLAEFGPGSRTAGAVRFCAKMLTGFPSILAGVFAYALVVQTTGGFSAPAGGVALALLMLPTVMLTAEEAIRMVPAKMREAAIGMGCTPTQLTWRVILPTAVPGILTGVMLAVARAAGETAPLIFTALFSKEWLISGGRLNLMEPTASLAVLIYNFSGMPYENQIELAWSASLVLVLIVLLLNIGGQIFSKRSIR